jgi:NAD(P)-dependent dehydrogenase (short-subunit alcohol dehydrogenase family)
VGYWRQASGSPASIAAVSRWKRWPRVRVSRIKADDLLTIQTDLTSDAATEEITKATRARFGRIDILAQ